MCMQANAVSPCRLAYSNSLGQVLQTTIAQQKERRGHEPEHSRDIQSLCRKTSKHINQEKRGLGNGPDHSRGTSRT